MKTKSMTTAGGYHENKQAEEAVEGPIPITSMLERCESTFQDVNFRLCNVSAELARTETATGLLKEVEDNSLLARLTRLLALAQAMHFTTEHIEQKLGINGTLLTKGR